MERPPPPLSDSQAVTTDVLGRRVWNKTLYAEKAAEKDATGDIGDIKRRKIPAASERTFLTRREDDLQLEKDIGKQKVFSAASEDAQRSGFWCDVCGCLLKDSAAYLDHLNGKKHNRYLGMSMKVKKATKDDVKLRLQRVKEMKEQLNFSKPLVDTAVIGGRAECPKCKRRSWIYCPHCVVLLDDSFTELLPKIDLPISITVLKHPLESSKKSTSIPLATLAPSVKIFEITDADSNEVSLTFDPQKSILLFPSDNARNVDEADWSNVENVVVFEGTWNQATTIYNTVKDLNCQTLKLGDYKTVFWRYNGLPDSKYCDEKNLATIESIYFLSKEIQKANKIQKMAEVNIDDILWFFALQHKERSVEDPKTRSTMRRERVRQLNQERSALIKKYKCQLRNQ